jgi:hypothetical protein
MKLKNYTSGVPVDRSVANIERKLVEAGATRISKVYAGQELAGVMFQIGNVVFKLPSRVDQVEKAMMAEVRKPRKETAARIKDQAARTADQATRRALRAGAKMVSSKQLVSVLLAGEIDGYSR